MRIKLTRTFMLFLILIGMLSIFATACDGPSKESKMLVYELTDSDKVAITLYAESTFRLNDQRIFKAKSLQEGDKVKLRFYKYKEGEWEPWASGDFFSEDTLFAIYNTPPQYVAVSWHGVSTGYHRAELLVKELEKLPKSSTRIIKNLVEHELLDGEIPLYAYLVTSDKTFESPEVDELFESPPPGIDAGLLITSKLIRADDEPWSEAETDVQLRTPLSSWPFGPIPSAP